MMVGMSQALQETPTKRTITFRPLRDVLVSDYGPCRREGEWYSLQIRQGPNEYETADSVMSSRTLSALGLLSLSGTLTMRFPDDARRVFLESTIELSDYIPDVWGKAWLHRAIGGEVAFKCIGPCFWRADADGGEVTIGDQAVRDLTERAWH